MFNEYNQKQFNCGEGFYFKQSQEVALRAKKRVGVTPLSYSSDGDDGGTGTHQSATVVESHVLVLIAIGYSKGRIIIIVINRNVLSYFNGIIKKGVALDAKDTIEERSIDFHQKLILKCTLLCDPAQKIKRTVYAPGKRQYIYSFNCFKFLIKAGSTDRILHAIFDIK